MKQNAIIVLHEIYGINNFIKSVCRELEFTFDVICPNLLKREPFSYNETNQAYQFFQDEVGFDIYKDICDIAKELRTKYKKVFLLGFSVGATIAWRCSEIPLFEGVIGCYGSRIRDYMKTRPYCRTLLIFAKENLFDVDQLLRQLSGISNITCIKYSAGHGFLDQNTNTYDENIAIQAKKEICNFLSLDIQ